MERSVVAGLRSWVGRRVVVRYRLPDGRATDVLGTLVEVGRTALVVRRDRVRDDAPALVEVSLQDVVLAKPVPAPPPARGARPRPCDG